MRGLSWLAEELLASIYIYEVNDNLYIVIHIAQGNKYI